MNVLDAIIRQEDLDQLQYITEAVGRLSSGHQAVIKARFYKDLSVAETAELLGINIDAARSLQHRALTELRKWLHGKQPGHF